MGEIYFCNKNLGENYSSMIKEIGVFLKSDTLCEYLTVREHLELFANLKGIPTNIHY